MRGGGGGGGGGAGSVTATVAMVATAVATAGPPSVGGAEKVPRSAAAPAETTPAMGAAPPDGGPTTSAEPAGRFPFPDAAPALASASALLFTPVAAGVPAWLASTAPPSPATLHTLTLLSCPDVTKRVPSTAHAADSTSPRCPPSPPKIATHAPVTTFHRRAASSRDAVTASAGSVGCTATALIASPWPASTPTSARVDTLMRRRTPLWPPTSTQ